MAGATKGRHFTVRIDDQLSRKLAGMAQAAGLSEGAMLRKLLETSTLVHGVLLVGAATVPQAEPGEQGRKGQAA